jgi:hypothetical protein
MKKTQVDGLPSLSACVQPLFETVRIGDQRFLVWLSFPSNMIFAE